MTIRRLRRRSSVVKASHRKEHTHDERDDRGLAQDRGTQSPGE
jgi:hypothetical protein